MAQIKKLNNSIIQKILFFLIFIIIFLFLLSIIRYNNYEANKSLILKTKPVNYDILESYDKAKRSPRLLVLFNNCKYEVVILHSDYNNLNKVKPKLYFNKKQNRLISYHEISTYKSGFYVILILVIILIFPYKKVALLLMRVKNIHSYIKKEEPNVYQIYLDTINKKKSLK